MSEQVRVRERKKKEREMDCTVRNGLITTFSNKNKLPPDFLPKKANSYIFSIALNAGVAKRFVRLIPKITTIHDP